MTPAEIAYYGLAALGVLLSFAKLRIARTVSGKGIGSK